MGGIDPTIITHKLNTNPSFKSVKQKRRRFAPERQKAINEEVGKLIQAGATTTKIKVYDASDNDASKKMSLSNDK